MAGQQSVSAMCFHDGADNVEAPVAQAVRPYDIR
jgi:hypothetical protein